MLPPYVSIKTHVCDSVADAMTVLSVPETKLISGRFNFMRSTHTLWNMTVYDDPALCKVLQASEGQVLLQDLPTMEGAWK